MVVGVIVGTYSSIYIASPLLLIFGEGKPGGIIQRQPVPQAAQGVSSRLRELLRALASQALAKARG